MHIIRSTIPTVIVVALAATMLAACGDDANDETLTKSEFVDEVNALCTTQNQSIEEAIGPLFSGGEPSPEDQQQTLDKIVVLSRGLSKDITALAAPKPLADDVDALVASLDRGTDAAEAETGNEFFTTDGDPWSDASAKAHTLGLDACGSAGG